MAVLQTWEHLAEMKAIPLGHWQMVTTIATGEPAGCRIMGNGFVTVLAAAARLSAAARHTVLCVDLHIEAPLP